MITVRPAASRGHTDIGWLDSRHTFSFGDYYDPQHMGYRRLRVINDDRVAAGAGFGKHPHRDMEIVSYVLDGALSHGDSMGNGSIIRPGEVQRMSAGTGVVHSEQNASGAEKVHFLQIWIVPEAMHLSPSYEQKGFPLDAKRGSFLLVASRDGRDGSVTVHQDVAVWAGRFDDGQAARVPLAKGRHAWVHVARGSARVNGATLGEGDGAALDDETAVDVISEGASEILVFDLA